MRVVRIERFGRPDVLREREIPPPDLGADEVRVKVKASGVNFADLLQRLHLYGNAPKPPYVPGFEVAGPVIGVGAAVSDLSEGDRVCALTRFGGYAEEVCAPRDQVVCLPASISFEEAAAVPVNYLTAWFCLFEMGRLKAADRVVITGGAGGVGTAAVQLACHCGAEVFATAGSDKKVEFLARLGVHHPINYREQDFAGEVHRITGGRGADLFIDAVGGDTLKKGYKLLAPLGRLVSYGLSSAAPGPGRQWHKALLALWRTPRFRPLDLIQRNVAVCGFHLALLDRRRQVVSGAFHQIADLIANGSLRPIIAERFPLSQAGAIAAHRYLHERKNIGKVLLCRQSLTGFGTGI